MLAPTPFFSDRGCHVRIHEEAEALRRCGHEVGIVTYHLGRDAGAGSVWRIPNIPWYTKTSAGPSWHKPYLDVLLFLKAVRVARTWRPDIIHAHLHEGALLGVLLGRLMRLPVLFDCQGSLTGEILEHRFVRQGSFLHKLFNWVETWINRHVDQIATSSTRTMADMLEVWPELGERIFALPDAVDLAAFRPVGKDPALLHELGIPEDRKVLVYLGALSEPQGTDLMLEVLARLFRERRDLHALIMGFPEEKYREKAKALGLEGQVTFTGRIDYAKACSYLCLGDLALSPKLSRTEANGKLLNYMACGLPCVVFDTPVNRELLGETGVYAAYGDADAFAARIVEVVDNPEDRMVLSRQVREYVERHHSWEARVRRLVEGYEDMHAYDEMT
ncbi:glycosyltransferase involved in cell wall biosynthesis [Geothermobacter ehrlichii]|uniref:Glycosyltransferase involved in cell wall biosynthesis n=2 Tax=Geothermobacter ehrlichii TaxID=213224 RepID=A0A5D3WHM3_9BACT|nr:glycosyltransferase involved in cell wall biosynthesis [Geothermobacter ehrlichii]